MSYLDSLVFTILCVGGLFFLFIVVVCFIIPALVLLTKGYLALRYDQHLVAEIGVGILLCIPVSVAVYILANYGG